MQTKGGILKTSLTSRNAESNNYLPSSPVVSRCAICFRNLRNELFRDLRTCCDMVFAIRLMIIIRIIFGWYLCQVDFVMAYPQAPIELDIYMELPQGIMTAQGNSKDHVLKLEILI